MSMCILNTFVRTVEDILPDDGVQTRKSRRRNEVQSASLSFHLFQHAVECQICHESSSESQEPTSIQKAAITIAKEHGFGSWEGANGAHIFATLDLVSYEVNHLLEIKRDNSYRILAVP